MPRWLLVLIAILALAASESVAQGSREYDLKAAFLFNFPTFVEWPPEVFSSEESPFVIGVLGEDPFGAVLDDLVADEYTGKHPLVVRRFRRLDEIPGCHLLFISASEARRLDEILRRLQGRPVLTVSDLPDFAEVGGMIGFAKLGNRVQLHVNPGAAQAANLTVSSKLLELAHVVWRSAKNP